MLRSELRLPPEYRRSLKSFAVKRPLSRLLREGGLVTVCEEARCPNIGECYANNTATFMIMGDRCTRRCHFCAVTTKKPLPLNNKEPEAVAEAAAELGLDYVVITSVDRDELPDLGADHFVAVVKALKERLPHARIEVLTPDFKGRFELLDLLLESPLDVFGHNMESVERLYKKLRPQSDFAITTSVLKHAASQKKAVVKTGLMVGVGESDQEVLDTITKACDLGVSIVTIGQYLRPSLKHWPVMRYVLEDSFQSYIAHGQKIGLKHVFAGPFVRSSYHAKESHNNILN